MNLPYTRNSCRFQNYVSALNDEYNEKAVDSSSEEAQEEWDTYFENLKDKLVKEQNFQNQ